ncbi:thioredoxin family protein [Bdellovibrio sp.]|uniref:thioredoxin family protein n=1 Tax=Bdellovibrio TaxID=958 RepID=UPI0032214D52
MNKAIFYHAGCPVCLDAEQKILNLVDTQKYKVEIVHLGEQKSRITEAEKAGVKSVPALLVGGDALHINFGAALSDLK